MVQAVSFFTESFENLNLEPYFDCTGLKYIQCLLNCFKIVAFSFIIILEYWNIMASFTGLWHAHVFCPTASIGNVSIVQQSSSAVDEIVYL